MATPEAVGPLTPKEAENVSKLRVQYGFGSTEFSGKDTAFYERHLVFDDVIDVTAGTPRERFVAVARSVRDILSQRWIKLRTPIRNKIPSACLTSQWSFSSGARWRIMSRICCSILL